MGSWVAGVGVPAFKIDVELAVAGICPNVGRFSAGLSNSGTRHPVRASVEVFQQRLLVILNLKRRCGSIRRRPIKRPELINRAISARLRGCLLWSS